MADFPPNVDDARLLLPPELFFNDVIPSEFSLRRTRSRAMDDLAHQLAALSFLKQRRALSLQRFRPPVPNGQLDFQCRSCLAGFWNASGAHLPRTELCHHYPFPNPVQLQIGDGSNLLEPTAKALRRHHNQAQIGNQNRLVQFQANGIGSMGGFERVSGGTGVFHPRILDSTTTTMSRDQVKNKPGSRSRQEIRGIQPRNSMNKCVGMGEEHHQLRPEVVLPQEWTY